MNKYFKFSKSKSQNNQHHMFVQNSFIAQAELDFHNYGVIDHAEVERILYEFLEDCHIAGYTEVLVITGKGQIIRPLVKNLLGKHDFVSSCRYAGYFNGQDGAFEVKLVA